MIKTTWHFGFVESRTPQAVIGIGGTIPRRPYRTTPAPVFNRECLPFV
jgi:hypothetical protein